MGRLIKLSTALILFSALLCSAQEPAADPMEGLHFELLPYLIAPGMSGDATVQGNQATINASAGDIFSHLQFGFMAKTRVSYDQWFVGTDTVYMGLGGANQQVDAAYDSWVAELLGGYQVHRRLALLGGVRYNSLTANLRFKGPLGINPHGSQVWWDPFFGGEGTVPLTKKLSFCARFDLGGFGAGSRIAVNAEPLVSYRFNKRFRGTAGWKFFYEDYVNNGQNFEYDMLTQGPVFGIAIRW